MQNYTPSNIARVGSAIGDAANAMAGPIVADAGTTDDEAQQAFDRSENYKNSARGTGRKLGVGAVCVVAGIGAILIWARS